MGHDTVDTWLLKQMWPGIKRACTLAVRRNADAAFLVATANARSCSVHTHPVITGAKVNDEWFFGAFIFNIHCTVVIIFQCKADGLADKVLFVRYRKLK